MKRREFIQTSALAAAGMMAIPALSMPLDRKIGLQLYTLRDVIFKDTQGILKQVADFGYQELEAFSYNDGKLFGMTARDFGAYVKSLGMRVTSGHYQLGKSERTKAMKGSILNDWERAVADAKEIGQEYMVVAYLNADERKTIDDYKFVCEQLNKASEVCKQYGLRLNYHNHDFEFIKIDDQVPFQVMLSELEPKRVGIELDLYWTIFAGEQPADYFRKYPGRFEQWHLKDMDKTDRKRNAILGTGSIDFNELLSQGKEAGLVHCYVEHDTYPIGSSSLESVQADIAYLEKL
jgi:sugar phosphate isomerase/epimerase